MTNAKTYIVQLWSSNAEPVGFRASVRCVEEEDSLFFVNAEELARFLSQQIERPDGSAAPGADAVPKSR